MDESTRRNYQIEEQFPDGRSQSGFTYGFAKLTDPDMVSLEIRMSDNTTLRLFFEHEYFRDFVRTANVVERMLDAPDP